MSDGVGSGIPGPGDERDEAARRGTPASGAGPAAGPGQAQIQAQADAVAAQSAETQIIAAVPAPQQQAVEPPAIFLPPPAPYTAEPFPSGSGGYGAQNGEEPGSVFGRLPRRGLIAAGALVAVAAAGGIALAVTGSGGTKNGASGSGSGGSGSGNSAGGAGSEASASPSPTHPAATLTTVPANGASDVDPSKPVTVTVANGSITSVQLSGGQETSGTLSTDKSTWTSNGALSLNASYQLLVQATGEDGKSVSKTVAFSTLKPTATIGVLELWPGSGVSVGVGQPIRVQFTNYVPTAYRAAVEKACVVTTTPAVAGAWHWVDTDTMDWRPQNYWATNTHVSVALGLAGVRAGTHQYFTDNHSLDFTIRGTDLRLIIDAKAFKATAYQNGAVIRTFPIGTGANDPRFITWSGVFAVLGKGNPVEMKGDYGNGDKYDELVNWATQITYSGTYVHAAPWDGEIGRVNSSHGCIHASTTNATWFYNLAQVGDVVQVTGTSKTVAVTNGFGDWTLSWSSWLSGSAYGATLGGQPVST
jgi:lipoprotein-anchoring transpeptidase ErfK/SrfK